MKKTWCLSDCKKIDFILHIFLEIFQGYCTLVILGTVGINGYVHPKCYYQPVEILCLLAKNILYNYFFLKILDFKESCNLTGQQHFGPYTENQNFARYGIGGEIPITILVFILDYFQVKIMTTRFFWKSKNSFLGTFWALFALTLKNLWKKKHLHPLESPLDPLFLILIKRLSQFKFSMNHRYQLSYIIHVYYCLKSKYLQQ